MITLEVVELENGRFTVQAADGSEDPIDAGEFDTRVEAEDWLFEKSEELARNRDPAIILPGTGQGEG